MKYRNILCALVMFSCACIVQAQTVQWASTVLEFSSQYSDTASSARQILGKPNALPAGGDSKMAWAVAAGNDEGNESEEEASITVGFARPMAIQQVAIGESCAPGAIQRVALIDEGGEEHEILAETPQEVEEKARMLNIFFPLTSYRVKAVSITMQPGLVAGWNEIDAVGISDARDSIKATINLVPNLVFTSLAEHLGRNINSEASELIDGVSPDGKTLYLSRQGVDDNIGGAEAGRDVWYSTLRPDGTWSPAVNIGTPINNDANNFVNTVTPDGNSLLLGNTYTADGELAGPGVSISHRTATGWSVPETVEIDDYYNNSSTATYCLSPDGKVILMSVKRLDSYGENDLYASFLRRDGSWSKPTNMGSTINTPGNDIGPFVAADGVTLYYSSSGLTGYGGNDIFITRRLDNSWTKWSEPQNLGPRINTPEFDAYYILSAAGDYAYFSSSTDAYGAEDIFRIALPKEIRPQPVVLVYGRVFDAKTKQPIASDIHYEILPKGTDAGAARSNPANGEYKIALPVGSNFGFRAEAQGYYPVSENLNTEGITEYREIAKDLYLAPVEVGQTIRLNNIFFATAKADLQPESYPELDRAIQFLKDNPNITIAVNGHTDNVGNDASNMTLSKNRAQSVVEYLASHGIAAARLSSNGYGETKPEATNDTDEGRQLNRRVEFTILTQ
jgi:outer membrane protein OmpA-like peptidoglycan-associated protein